MLALILPYRNTSPQIADEAFIAANATVIGAVRVGAGSGVWFGCVLRGDVGFIEVGEDTNIQDGTVVHVSRTKGGDTRIGSRVSIGHMAMIHACTLEDDCFVGMKACVMDGAVVESGGWVAAGAVVTPNKRILKGQVWAGTPARYLRDLTEKEAAFIADNAAHYARLAKEYR